MSSEPNGIPITLVKMNGLGNEIVVVDLRASRHVLTARQAIAIAEHPPTHFDQLMAIHKPRTAGTNGQVLIYNSDGSRAGACGNGMRCVGLLLSAEARDGLLRFETDAGLLDVRVESQTRITVDMGKPRFAWREIPLSEPFHDTRRIELQVGPPNQPIVHSPSVVNVGNPHAVFWVDDPAAIDLARIGPMLEHHPLFPDRANISLARIDSRTAITLRTWERGAGLTRACGSAACAAAVTAARLGRTERKVAVTLPGGTLDIEWRADDHIWMTGPAEFEQRYAIDLASFD